MFDRKGWRFILTWGSGAQLYAKGNRRVLIDKHTCDIILEYDFKPRQG